MSRQNYSLGPTRRGQISDARRRPGQGLPVGQGEYIAGIMLEEERLARPPGNATGHVGNQLENILRIKARISLRHFAWEGANAHKYRNTDRRL